MGAKERGMDRLVAPNPPNRTPHIFFFTGNWARETKNLRSFAVPIDIIRNQGGARGDDLAEGEQKEKRMSVVYAAR